MNKSIINKIISGLGVMALVGMVYLGVNAFKSADDTKVSHNVEAVADEALVVALGKNIPTVEDLVWFPIDPSIPPTIVYNVNNFLLDQGQLSSSGNPYGCTTGSYYCAIGVPVSQCTSLGGGLYQLNSDAGHDDSFHD